MHTDTAKGKAALRKVQKARRAAIPLAEKQAADSALCALIAALPQFKNADTLLAFYPMEHEVDLRALYRVALQEGKCLAFPRCEGTQMTFHRTEALEALTKGRFGILTPHGDAPTVIPTERTLCLLPALAATPQGARLGYGGGFYDRFLQNAPCHTLLPIYRCLLLSSLPTEPTDICAEITVTEKGVLP